jgi:hypothetical protein
MVALSRFEATDQERNVYRYPNGRKRFRDQCCAFTLGSRCDNYRIGESRYCSLHSKRKAA